MTTMYGHGELSRGRRMKRRMMAVTNEVIERKRAGVLSLSLPGFASLMT